MSLHIYKSFCLVAETKSISKAARLLHASQPTIGAQIKSLEQTYASTLFNRSNHGVELTASGEIVYRYAKQLLHLQKLLIKDIEMARSKDTELIKIGADSTVGNYFLPFLLSNYRREHPSIQIEMFIMNQNEICEKVIKKDIHIGIIDGPSQCCTLPEYIESGQISDDEIYLVAPPHLRKHPTLLTVDELTRIPLVMPSQELKIREVIELNLNNLGVSLSDLNIVCELNSISAMKSYVIAGYGTAFFCDLSIKRDIEYNNLQIHKINGLNMSMTYYFIYHKEFENSNHKNLVTYLNGKVKRKDEVKQPKFIEIKLSKKF